MHAARYPASLGCAKYQENIIYSSDNLDIQPRTSRLFNACLTGNVTCISAILEEGPFDTGAVTAAEGYSIPHVCAKEAAGTGAISALLADNNAAGFDVSKLSLAGETPLHLLNSDGGRDPSDDISALTAAASVDVVTAADIANCSAGYYEHEGECVKCRAGHWCMDGKSQYCPHGTYQPEEGQTECVNDCGEGYYTSKIDGSPVLIGGTNCTICPPGHFCPGDGLYYDCTRGTYQPEEGQSTCREDCGEGYYTSDINGTGITAFTNCTICPPGYACRGNGYHDECGHGRYQPEAGQSSCLDDCPKGSYTVAKEGWATTTGATDCVPCTIGRECPGEGRRQECSSDSYAPVTGMASCKVCPSGTEPTFEHTSCIVPPGQYIKSGSLVGLDADIQPCPAGYECAGGDAQPKVCEKGYYSYLGNNYSFCDECRSGSYTSLDDGTPVTTAATHCKRCEAGRKCPGQGVRQDCEGKFYSHAGADACSECGVGHFVTKQDGLSTECTACPAGQYQPAQGQTSCLECPASTTSGTKTDRHEIGARTCWVRSGWHLVGGRDPTQTADVAQCPVGHTCAGGFYDPKPCTYNTYQPTEGQTECLTDCSAGSYTHDASGTPVDSAATHCTVCERGYECTSYGVRRACTGAKYSRAGATSCSICATGSYTTQSADAPEGNDTCTPCEAGHFCTDGGERQDCVGKLYTFRKRAAHCDECSRGHFVTTVDGVNTNCTPCPCGQYQPAQGETNCLECPASTTSGDIVEYNRDGATTCTVRPGWHLVGGRDPTQTADVAKCPVGHTCAGGASAKVACVHGAYQPDEGQTECLTCAATSYTRLANGTPVLSAATRCTTCEAGYECPGAGVRRVCSGAKYSRAGAAGCSTCPTGSYTTQSASAPEGNDACTNPDKPGLNTAAIAGITVGVMAAVIVTSTLTFFFFRRKNNHKSVCTVEETVL